MDEERIKFILKFLEYVPRLGHVVWKIAPSRKGFLLGKPAGCLDSNGYVRVKILKKMILEHRIVWFMHYNEWPPEIDHKDRIRNNNKVENLQASTRLLNSQNIPLKDGHSSGRIGVCRYKAAHKGMHWQAYFQARWLGAFATREEAIAARVKAEIAAGLTNGAALP